MALVKSTLQQEIEDSSKDAAYDAYLAAMKVELTITDAFKQGGGIADFADQLRIAQSTEFAKVFSESIAPKLAKHIDDYIKSGDVNVNTLESVFTGVTPVPQDGGASLLTQLLAKAKLFDTNTKNGEVK